MIEIREYKIAELVEILGTRNRQGIRRKLIRYGCEFEETGWGKRAVFNIMTAPDKFNVFCITELNIPAQVDLRRLKMFYYAFFEDEEVMIMSDIDREIYMDEHYEHISRQTIRNWIGYLERESSYQRNSQKIYLKRCIAFVVSTKRKKSRKRFILSAEPKERHATIRL